MKSRQVSSCSIEESAYHEARSRPLVLYCLVRSYIEVLKPRETLLLIFIGGFAAIVAGGGYPPLSRLLWALLAIGLGSAGCNGLTNYLDREVDARMQRTQRRPLPSRRINPPEKALPLTVGLVVLALVIAWFLHPFAFLAGLVGVVAAVVARKTSATHFLGGLSGCAPVLVGWLAIAPYLNPTILVLCGLIIVWVPMHVWSLMTAYREDYLQAGLHIFPLNWRVESVVKLLLTLSILTYGASIALYGVGDFGWLYLIAANILGLLVLYASWRLLAKKASREAWRVYKLSAYPYLGLLFLFMSLDLWL